MGEQAHQQEGDPGPAAGHDKVVPQQHKGGGQRYQGKIKDDHGRVLDRAQPAHDGVGEPAAEGPGDGDGYGETVVFRPRAAKQERRAHHDDQAREADGDAGECGGGGPLLEPQQGNQGGEHGVQVLEHRGFGNGQVHQGIVNPRQGDKAHQSPGKKQQPVGAESGDSLASNISVAQHQGDQGASGDDLQYRYTPRPRELDAGPHQGEGQGAAQHVAGAEGDGVDHGAGGHRLVDLGAEADYNPVTGQWTGAPPCPGPPLGAGWADRGGGSEGSRRPCKRSSDRGEMADCRRRGAGDHRGIA